MKIIRKHSIYFGLCMLLLLSSCYVYKPYSEIELEEVTPTLRGPGSVRSSSLTDLGQAPTTRRASDEANSMRVTNMSKEQNEPQEKVNNPLTNHMTRSDGSSSPTDETEEVKNEKTAETVEKSLKEKIQPNKYFKISVAEKQYKIAVEKWEGDTLMAHVLRQPDKKLKFHENQIDEENLLERRFSKSYSDLLTIGSYVVGGAVVLLLVL